jgi:hypothetical protein
VKVGDLVKFSDMSEDTSPVGIVLGLAPNPRQPHPNESADVVWCNEYTPNGWWGTNLLEVADAGR